MIPHTRSAHLRLLERKLLHWRLNECSGHFWLHRSRSHVVFLAAFLPLEHKGNGCIRAIFTRQKEYRSLQKHRYSKNQRYSRVKDLYGKQNLIVWSGCKIWIDIYIYICLNIYNDNNDNMGWYMGSYKAKSVRVFESLGEKTERDSKATPISTIQGYGWLRRLRMVTETWVMASGDVDVGWSRLISVDVALWFSSGAAFHAFLSIFSASAVLHEANLLSLLTELLTLHHDAIPLFSGNVLIWTKKTLRSRTELKLVVHWFV